MHIHAKYCMGGRRKVTWNTSMGTIFWVALWKYQYRDPNDFTCCPQNRWGMKEILCLTWPLAVLLLVITTKEALSEPTRKLCYSLTTTEVVHEVLHTIKNSRHNIWKLLLLLLSIIGLSEEKEFWYYTYEWLRMTAWEFFFLMYIQMQICQRGYLVQLNKSYIT